MENVQEMLEIFNKLDACSQAEILWYAKQVEKHEHNTLFYKNPLKTIDTEEVQHYDKRGRWGEYLTAQYFKGKLATNKKQEGWDVIDSNGIRYQVKTKEAFLENLQYDPIRIPLTKSSSHEFDYLIVIGVTAKSKKYIEARMWSVEEVKKSQGKTTYFNLTTKKRWEQGKFIKLL